MAGTGTTDEEMDSLLSTFDHIYEVIIPFSFQIYQHYFFFNFLEKKTPLIIHSYKIMRRSFIGFFSVTKQKIVVEIVSGGNGCNYEFDWSL